MDVSKKTKEGPFRSAGGRIPDGGGGGGEMMRLTPPPPPLKSATANMYIAERHPEQ